MSVHRPKHSGGQNRPQAITKQASNAQQWVASTGSPFVVQGAAWKRREAKRPSEAKTTKMGIACSGNP